MFIDNLYKRIIKMDFRDSDTINILSGYGSGKFLEKVMSDCPELKINLYLGMTQEGVSRSSHDIFQYQTKNNPNINVYYQVDGLPNHMKIYTTLRRGIQTKSFVGSANFTENGFEYNKEILVEKDIDFTEVFNTQFKNSLICTNSDIEKYVNIYDVVTEKLENNEIKGKDKTSSGQTNKVYDLKSDKLIKIRNEASSEYYKEFDIEVVKYNDKNWESTGINEGLYGGVPYISIGNKLYLKKVFPRDIEFFLLTSDGNEYKVISSSKNKDSLYFLYNDIYDYFRNKLNLKEKRPISRKDLEAIRSNNMKFVRMDKLKYYVEFY